MTTEINVEPLQGDTYRVTVADSRSSSTHEVTIDTRPAETTDEDLLRAAFQFLLEREPKEAILSRFDLSVISRYFPEYDARIATYL